MEVKPICGIPVERFETVDMLKRLLEAQTTLAQVSGEAQAIPNQNILINTLSLQEARGSSVIENVMTTFRGLIEASESETPNHAEKEVLSYRRGLELGLRLMREKGYLSTSVMIAIANEINGDNAGVRRLPGTVLRDGAGNTVFEPPQNHEQIQILLGDLERFLNDPQVAAGMNPLVRMALAHWHFECIHPFYDGNGRTGRILNVLYLMKEGLIQAPILYLSRHIVRTKLNYYETIRTASEAGDLEAWVSYMLEVVHQSSRYTLSIVRQIREGLTRFKQGIRATHSFYSQDLLNLIFLHPHTTIQRASRELRVTRKTATKYLDALVASEHLERKKLGRRVFYFNPILMSILSDDEATT
ncbi:MAG: Fic family protein [Planctomycetes bacterium]|nr:Fic family protein [Planctomycetota bacterium]